MIYGIPPQTVEYECEIGHYIKELLKAQKNGNQELVVTHRGEVMGCITIQSLLGLYPKVYQLSQDDLEEIKTVYRCKLTRDKILKETRKKRSLFVFKEGVKQKGYMDKTYIRELDAEITRELALAMIHKELEDLKLTSNCLKPNYPSLITYLEV
jgi:hypothetical protein